MNSDRIIYEYGELRHRKVDIYWEKACEYIVGGNKFEHTVSANKFEYNLGVNKFEYIVGANKF